MAQGIWLLSLPADLPQQEHSEAGIICLFLQKGLHAPDTQDCPTRDRAATHPCSKYPSKWWAGGVADVWADWSACVSR